MMIYYIVLTIHLVTAIIFVGFLFTDVVIFRAFKKLGLAFYDEATSTIYTRGVKFMPFNVLALFLSGGYMLSYHMPINTLFAIKLTLAALIALGAIYMILGEVFHYRVNGFIERHFHTFALLAALVLIIIAKFMFVV